MLAARGALARVATGGYILHMIHVSIKEAKSQLTALARRVEAGERVVVTRNGRPAFEMVPHVPRKGGIDWEAGRRYRESLGVDQIITYVAPDFDDPLPEDFLVTPLPE